MRHILYILAFLLLFNCEKERGAYEMHQRKDGVVFKFNNSTIEADAKLVPYVKEFIDTSIKYNIPIDSISKTYTGIYIDIIPLELAGITYTDSTGISFSLISPDQLLNIRKVKMIVFHEMAHKFVMYDHCHTTCGEIMSSIVGSNNYYGNWEEQKRILFLNIAH